MAVLNAQANGNAPANSQVGDFVNTSGGMYQIVAPGTYGSSYNPSSGLWSVKAGENVMTSLQNQADINSAKSQEFAREQMAFQEESNAKAMQFSSDQAQLNRDWQEKMSNTAHQREVVDLISAGLNPILSALNGNGASTPSGVSASGVTSSGASGTVDTSAYGAIASIIGSLVNQQTSLQIAQLQSDTALKTGSMSASAVLGSAATSASAQMAINRDQIAFQNYVKENYPSTLTSAVFSGINAVSDLMLGGSSGKYRNNLANIIEKSYHYLKDLKI